MHVHRFGTGRPRVIALHGFAQQGGHFWEIAQYIGATVIAPDLPGHGPDPHLPATMGEAVERVGDLIDEYEPEVVLGYSMGGRVALRAALSRPVGLLVLVSVSAGIVDPGTRAARAVADSALADRIEEAGLESFLDSWQRMPMFEGRMRRSADWQRTDRSLRATGTPAGIAASLRGMGQGVVDPITEVALAGIAAPTVCLAGRADPTYAKEANRIAALVPSGTSRIHPAAGHSLIDEDPGWVSMTVRRAF